MRLSAVAFNWHMLADLCRVNALFPRLEGGIGRVCAVIRRQIQARHRLSRSFTLIVMQQLDGQSIASPAPGDKAHKLKLMEVCCV